MLPIQNHNQFYLAEDRRQAPKEYFKFLVEQASHSLAAPSPKVLDIGCAAGDFLYYLRSLYPDARLTGIDTSDDFLKKAATAVPSARFLLADVYTGANLPDDLYDVVFMSGVHSYFADYEAWIRNLVSLTCGSAYVFGPFNPENLDVRATISRPGDETSHVSWNQISQKSISAFLQRCGVDHSFKDWELPFENPRVHDDPMRSWTIGTAEGRYLIVNGTQMIQRLAVLRLTLNGSASSDHATGSSKTC
jgi:SAM-dependent methyltransferase